MKKALVLLQAVAVLIAMAAVSLSPAQAVQPNEILADPILEQRARALSRTIRCLVCQNQSIDDSDAELARDLRLLIRERLQAGESDAMIRDFLVARYGDFVLLDPPVKPATYFLWGGPLLVLACGLTILVLFFRRRRDLAAPEPLSAQETSRLAALAVHDQESPR